MLDSCNISQNSIVSLRKISEETVLAICNLSVHENQKQFVALNSVSIAQAHYSKYSWLRAIYADDVPVGFMMLLECPEKDKYFLCRFMIDARFQGMGFGKKALILLIKYIRSKPNVKELLTSVCQNDGGPQAFYEKMGFELTGSYEDDEAVMRLIL